MSYEENLSKRCQVSTNADGDSFVGVKADTNGAYVYFPIGYQLPPNDNDLRADINNLFNVLSAFMKEDKVIEDSKCTYPRKVDFPMHAYLKVIRDFLRTGRYYIETDQRFKTDTKGAASWPRTLREQRALLQKNGSLIFTKMTVRSTSPNADKKITQIHRYCVYEAFEKMGWLYVPFMPELPGPHPETREAIYILEKKMNSKGDDMEQSLFSAMKSMLEYMDEKNSDKQFFFGTYFFEHIWQKMIDKAFGISKAEKGIYFPRTTWALDYGFDKTKRPLQPDSIMLYKDNIYVLDAKLYRYASTFPHDPNLLPDSSDIHKQITYAEFIEQNLGKDEEHIYNAFIMPFNSSHNLFKNLNSDGTWSDAITGCIGNIGEATSDWKSNSKHYEHVQGIVIDTRYLMYNYISTPTFHENQKKTLAESIKSRFYPHHS